MKQIDAPAAASDPAYFAIYSLDQAAERLGVTRHWVRSRLDSLPHTRLANNAPRFSPDDLRVIRVIANASRSYDYSEAADWLGVTPNWLRRRISTLPHSKVGKFVRFSEGDLFAIMDSLGRNRDA